MIAFEIPGKPRTLLRPRRARNGGMFDPPQNKANKREIAMLCKRAMGKSKPFTGAVSIDIVFYKKTPKQTAPAYWTTRPDVDNCCKLILDALNGLAYQDDAQVAGLHAVKKTFYSKSDEYTKVEIWSLEQDGNPPL